VGIVSDRDLLATRGEGPAAVDRPDASDDANGGADTTIRAITKTRVLTASRETAIRQIAFVMIEQRIGAMPIIDESGHLEGIITRSDILRAVVNQAPLELWV
jgi:CBS domain-containing protein